MGDYLDHSVYAQDENGDAHEIFLADEEPLTICVNDKPYITLLTLGAFPEALAIGYLRNQRLLRGIEEIISIETGRNMVSVRVRVPLPVTVAVSGCGIGSAFAVSQNEIMPFSLSEDISLSPVTLTTILERVDHLETVYKKTGAVHGCALTTNAEAQSEIIYFVEDVGRHNAVDTVAGLMWKNGISGTDKIFYTTGRLSSEIVLKIAHMGIPFLVSRSMLTQRGFDIAERLDMTIIGRARRDGYWVFGKQNRFRRDQI
ncbi:MAG: formate dehydrogenase accessory sulfurtransferase FdhD [Burkholderiales bacterium]|jgi:FdhD protein|nr:formate dehydrogenase accessory sulfurtransferase FdhD [Burkholderiales bacterium]